MTSSQSQSAVYSTLYVGDLHPLATDGMLVSTFSNIGQVLSARVCRDLGSRTSLGYGYVNFVDPQDAERALELLNFNLLCGRPMRIMWSQRDPSLRKSGKGNIFIKNLAKEVDQKSLFDTFSTFGTVLSSKVALDENGVSKGFGFVHFENEEDAQRAIETINNMEIMGRQVYVGKFIPKTERKSQAEKKRFNNIYVKNFPTDTDDEKLHEMFSEFGEIKSACTMKDSEGKSKGFGFVCFLDPEHAENAVSAMHNKDINGRLLFAARAQKKEERQEELKRRAEKQRIEKPSRPSNVNLYVKNLDDYIDDKKLWDAFSGFGDITSAKVMLDEENRSKGFGFVCFAHPDQATKAVTDMNNTIIGSKPLFVALAQRKEDRRARLFDVHQQRIAQFRNTFVPMLQPVGQQTAQNYFPSAAFPQARYYHPTNTVLGSQPRWNRNAAMTAGIPAQLNAAQNRPQMPGQFGANHPGGFSQNQISNFGPLRAPNVGRPMVPSGVPSLPTGHLLTGPVLNQGVNQRQPQARQGLVMPQVMDASTGLGQRPGVTGGVNPNIRPTTQPRPAMHSGIAIGATAQRNIQVQPALVSSNMSNAFGPVNEQNLRTALNQMSEEEQYRTLGEHLYPLVHAMYPQYAGKLTGMLLKCNTSEIIQMLISKELLRERCEGGIPMLTGSQKATANGVPNQDGDKSNMESVVDDAKTQHMNDGIKVEQSV